TYTVIVFFFQAEDGIRDRNVTGVQTCALPIFAHHRGGRSSGGDRTATSVMGNAANTVRASSGGVKMGVKNMVDNGQGKKKKGPRSEERRVGEEGRGQGGAER